MTAFRSWLIDVWDAWQVLTRWAGLSTVVPTLLPAPPPSHARLLADYQAWLQSDQSVPFEVWRRKVLCIRAGDVVLSPLTTDARAAEPVLRDTQQLAR